MARRSSDPLAYVEGDTEEDSIEELQRKLRIQKEALMRQERDVFEQRAGTANPETLAAVEDRGIFRDPKDQERLAHHDPDSLLSELNTQKGLLRGEGPNARATAPIREGRGEKGERFFTNLEGTPKGGVEGSFQTYEPEGSYSNIGGRVGEVGTNAALDRDFENLEALLDSTPPSANVIAKQVAKDLPKFQAKPTEYSEEKLRRGVERGRYSAGYAATMNKSLADVAAMEVEGFVAANKGTIEDVAHDFGGPAAIAFLTEPFVNPGKKPIPRSEIQGRKRLAAEIEQRMRLSEQDPDHIPVRVKPGMELSMPRAARLQPATITNPEGKPGPLETAEAAQAATIDEMVGEPLPAPGPTTFQLAAGGSSPTAGRMSKDSLLRELTRARRPANPREGRLDRDREKELEDIKRRFAAAGLELPN